MHTLACPRITADAINYTLEKVSHDLDAKWFHGCKVICFWSMTDLPAVPHDPQRGLCNSGRFCRPCLSPSDLRPTGKGLGLESHRALLGTSDLSKSQRAAVWRQPKPAVNTALGHSEGRKKVQKDDTGDQAEHICLGLARQCPKHLRK